MSVVVPRCSARLTTLQPYDNPELFLRCHITSNPLLALGATHLFRLTMQNPTLYLINNTTQPN